MRRWLVAVLGTAALVAGWRPSRLRTGSTRSTRTPTSRSSRRSSKEGSPKSARAASACVSWLLRVRTKATLDGYYASADKTIDVAEQLQEAAEDGDESKADNIADSNDANNDEGERLGKQYGFVCAS